MNNPTYGTEHGNEEAKMHLVKLLFLRVNKL